MQSALAKCREHMLSSPQPDFKHDIYTFSGCLLLQRLVITGQTAELVRRKQEIEPSTLSHTCKWLTGSPGFPGWDKVRFKLKMFQFDKH